MVKTEPERGPTGTTVRVCKIKVKKISEVLNDKITTKTAEKKRKEIYTAFALEGGEDSLSKSEVGQLVYLAKEGHRTESKTDRDHSFIGRCRLR